MNTGHIEIDFFYVFLGMLTFTKVIRTVKNEKNQHFYYDLAAAYDFFWEKEQ